MNNLLFSFADLGQNIYNGLTNSLGLFWFNVLINFIGAVAILVKVVETQNKKVAVKRLTGSFKYMLLFFAKGD